MKIKVGVKLYPFPSRPLQLGEARLVKREFGVVFGVDEINWDDPDHISAVLYAAMREEDHGEAPAKQLLALINRTRTIEIVNDDGDPYTEDDAEPDESDPTPEASGEGEAGE